MVSSQTIIKDTCIGYVELLRICRKYGINAFSDYILLLPCDQQIISHLMISFLDQFLGHEFDSKNKKVLLITDGEGIASFAQRHCEKNSEVHIVDTKLLNQIITCCSMYMPSSKVFIGMLSPLQCRGNAENLKLLGIDQAEIVKNGIYNINGIKTLLTRRFVSITNLFQYVIAGTYYLEGRRVYRRIVPINIECKTRLYIYDYSGMGDVYVLSLYLKKVIDSCKDIKTYLVVKNAVCGRTARMSGIDDVLIISEHQMKMLTYYARAARFTDDAIKIITPFPKRVPTDIYSHYLYGNRINMAEAYWCIMFDLKDKKVDYPNIPRREEKISNFFIDNGLRKGNTVIISPNANTINGFSDYFWETVANRLGAEGFDVCTNATDNEPGIKGTKKVFFEIEDAEHIVDDAGYFLAMRSGLCDIVCNSSGFKCILYPEYEMFNSSVYEFTSFEKMGLGRNIYEIRWDFEKYDELADVVVRRFLVARGKN